MRRRIVMSMLAGAALLASTLFGTGAATAETAAQAADAPAEFGTDWHDPVTAAPPVTRPHTKSCQVTLAEHQFRDFTPYRGAYTPPRGCGEHWSKVVLRLDGKVKGRQFDRLGYLHVGGAEILRTSTPEPSPEGVEWRVEKDVTRYGDIFRGPRDVEMLIGNVVDDTYTGVIDVRVTLTFYRGRPETPAPDRVLTLTGAADATTLTTPRNSERIVAEVYATGSGGGCEEFWYLTAPDPAAYSCRAGHGPYREVQIKVDGQLAGIAAPFPHVWTGGWSNPFLWYVLPAPRAFDVRPVEYDLTPFAGLLNDGRPHRVEVSVVGVPAGRSGWSAPVNVLVWRDAHREHVTGALTRSEATDVADSSVYTPGAENRVDTDAGHRLTVSGHLNTSHGRVTTTVTRALANTSAHRWTDGEDTDALDAVWADDETVTVEGAGPERTTRTHRTYTVNGAVTLGADGRLRTVLTLGDRATVVRHESGRRAVRSRLDDTYSGDAAYTVDVPRDQRHAVGTSNERYRVHGPAGCWDRSLGTAQGALTEDRRRC
ncbi:peptide-N4-asparagine amidase [Streptomyces cellostaticus]|uniref:peptide-N4-asparagine amidase n=1 Tax=Streptomyces cellostaticus TaxID=67285 RepID=UPI0020271F5B|nr:peptide-N4-asparagine amidase [Streptomyces cellostaticus]